MAIGPALTYAATFTGGAYLQAPSSAAYQFGTGPFTLEARVKAQSPGGSGTVIGRKGAAGGAGNGGFLLVIKPDGSIKLATDNGFGYWEVDTSPSPVNDGNWHHLAAVRSGSSLTIYVDGTAVAGTLSGSITGPLDVGNSLPLTLGTVAQTQEPYRFFSGSIDTVAIWNVARSAAQIVADKGSILTGHEAGIVGYFPFDLRSGLDVSPTRNDAVAVGAVTYTTPGGPPYPGDYALTLAGGAYLEAPFIPAYQIGTGPFTIEAWVQTTAPGGSGTILGHKGTSGGAGNGGFLLVVRPDGTIKLATDNGSGYWEHDTSPTVVNDGGWHFVAAVRNDMNFAVYVDGVQVPGNTTGSITGPLDVSNGLTLTIGTVAQQQEPYRAFTGTLDMVALWNVARSGTNVVADARGVIPDQVTGLVAYYTFDLQSAYDSTQNHNYAAEVGPLSYTTPGAPGDYAALFSNGAYLEAPSNGAYQLGTGPFTIEAWLRVFNPGTAGTIVGRKGTSGGAGNGGFLLVLEPDGSFKLATDNGFGYWQIVTVATVVEDGAWHHVAAVRNGASFAIYVDGGYVPGTVTGSIAGPLDVGNGLTLTIGTVGQTQEPYRFLTALLDDVALWNVARTQPQIVGDLHGPLTGKEAGLAGYFRFDSRTGYDSSNTHNTAAGVGIIGYTTPGAPRGIVPRFAATFSGGGYLEAPSNGAYQFGTGPFTVEAWVKAATPGAAGTIVGRKGTSGGAGNGGFLLVVQPSGAVKLATDDGFGYWQIVTVPTFVNDGSWHHLAAVRNSSSLTVYVDGVLVPGTLSGSGSPPLDVDNGLTLTIGTVAQTQEPYRAFNGSVGAVALWSGARSAQLIGSDMVTVLTGLEFPLAGYFGFDGPSANDVSSSHNNAALVGNVTFTTPGAPFSVPSSVSRWPYIARMRGGGYINLLGTPTCADNSSHPFSVSCRLRIPTPTSSLCAIAGKGGLYFGVRGTQLVVWAGGQGWQPSLSLTPGVFHQVALTWDGTVLVLYCDGQTDGGSLHPLLGWPGTNQGGWLLANAENFQVGQSAGPLDCDVECVKFWCYALTAAQAAADPPGHTATDGVTAFFDFTQNPATGFTTVPGWVVGLGFVGNATMVPVAVEDVTLDVSATAVGVSFSSVDGATRYGIAMLQAGAQVAQASTTGTSGSLPLPTNTSTTAIVTVQGFSGTAYLGTASAPVTVILAKPALTSVTCDGVQVSGAWGGLSAAGLTGYTLAIFQGTTLVASTTTTAGTASMPASLQAGVAYMAQVRATGDHTSGPWSDPVPVLASGPQSFAATVSATSIDATWNAVVGATSYRLTLLQGTTDVSHVDVTSTSGSLPLPADLTQTYTLQVRATAGTSAGPSSAVTVILTRPALTSVTYDGAQVSGAWGAVTAAGVTGYTLAVYQGSTLVAQVSSTGASASVAAALQAGTSYVAQVRATGAGSAGPWSAAVPIVVSAPQGLAASVSATTLDATWSALAGASGYRLSLLLGSNEIAFVDVTSTSGSLPIPADLTQTYALRVRATESGGISAGPWSGTVTVILAKPALTAVTYGSGVVVAAWGALAVAGVTGYVLAVFEGSTLVAQTAATSAQAMVTAVLQTGHSYVAQVRATGTSMLGPWSTSVPLVVDAPQGLSVAVSATTIDATWSAVAGASGYRVTLLLGTAEVSHVDVTSTSGSLSIPADHTQAYTLRVRATAGGGTSTGPWTSQVAVILTKPVPTSVAYDGAQVSATWGAVTAAGVTGYVLAVYQGSTLVAQVSITGTSASIAAALQAGTTYAVEVRATGVGTAGPWSDPVPIVMVVPQGLAASVSATTIDATWSAVTGATGYHLSLLQGGAEVASADVTSASGSVPIPADTSQTYTLAVRATFGISTGPRSSAVTVILAKPALTLVIYDGTQVMAAWGALAAASVTGYVLGVFEGTTLVAQVPATATLATVAAALQTGHSYVAQVRASGTSMLGPWSTPVPLVVDAPQGLTATVGATTIDATWSAVAGATGYRLTLMLGTAEVSHVDVTSTSGSLTIPADRTQAYTLQVRATEDSRISAGPYSSRVAVILTKPALTSVAYDGAQVSGAWGAVSAVGVTGYLLAVYQGSTLVAQVSSTGTSASMAATLQTGTAYVAEVRATGVGTSGPWSDPVPLVVDAPQGLAASVSATTIDATWSAVTGATGYHLSLLQGGATVASVDVTGTSGSLPIPADISQTYTLDVRATLGISTGPRSSALTVILATPTLTSVAYDGAQVSGAWGALAAAGVTGYVLAVFEGTALVAQITATATQASVATVLQTGHSYVAQVRATGTSMLGPWNTPVPLVVDAPQGLAASVSATTIDATWNAVTSATGYRLSLLQGGATVASTDVTSTSGSVPIPADTSQTYTLEVRATLGISTGPRSGALTVILAAPALTSVTYDGAQVSGAWGALAAAGVTGYMLAVFEGTTLVAQVAATATQASVATVLQTGHSYVAEVRATGTSMLGPWSTAVPLVVDAPQGVAGAVSATTIDATWSAVAGAGGYRVTLLQGTTAISHADVTSTSGSLPLPADLTQTYTLQVQGIAAGGISVGPSSSAVTVILAKPALTSVTYDGAQVSGAWGAVTAAGVTGYVLAVYQGSTLVAQVSSTAASASVAATLQTGTAYVAEVRATGAGSAGPWSDPVPLVVDAPQGLAASVGATIDATWSAVAGAAGYHLSLLLGTTEVWFADVTSPNGSAPIPTDISQTYTLEVRATLGISTGPRSSAVTVILAKPALTSVGYNGAQVSGAWGALAAAGVTGYELAVFEGAAVVAQTAATAAQASVAAVLQTGHSYVAEVRATGPSSAGPWSDPVSILVDVQQITSVAVDDTNIVVAWGTLPGVSGYRLVLFQGTAALLQVDGTTTSGTIPIPSDRTQSYAVAVQGYLGAGGTSTGPLSGQVAAIVAKPALSVDYDGTQVTGTWPALTTAGVTGYTLSVWNGTTLVGQTTTTSSPAQVAGVLAAGGTYTARLRGEGDRSTGAWCDPIPLILDAPTIAHVTWDGAATTVSFTPPAGVAATGYLGSVLVDGQQAYTASGAASPIAVPGALSIGHTDTVRVRATAGPSAGPWSAAQPILLLVPGGVLAATDGTVVTAAWSTLAGVDGYEASLAADGVWGAPLGATTPSCSFAGAMQSGVVYQVRVRAYQGISTGAWSAPAPGPFMRDSTIDYDGFGRVSRVAAQGLPAVVYAYDALGNITAVTIS